MFFLAGAAASSALDLISAIEQKLTGKGSPTPPSTTQSFDVGRRIDKATACGCRILVSETLSFLKSSLGNLRRAGFATAFEKEVYNSRPES